MKKIAILILPLFIFLFSNAQTIGTFTSVQSGAQVPQLILPATHTFQVLVKNGDLRTDGLAVMGWHDFTGYIPKGGSSKDGYVLLNEEIGGYSSEGGGGISLVRTHFNTTKQLWVVDSINQINLSALEGTYGNCSGGITPWGTGVSAEEQVTSTDSNGDGYNKNGWLIEIDPLTLKARDFGNGPQKLWAMGCIDHENVAIKNDGTVAYTGSDNNNNGFAFLYKFVPDVANNLSEGKLYVFKSTGTTTGDWIQVPNTTKPDRNSTNSLAKGLQAKDFGGIEDVEIGPDGKVYFTEKYTGRVYRLTDNGADIINFETFVESTNYTVNTDAGQQVIPWGNGNDNLCFDGEGNLWVLQDGAGTSLQYNYIWMVRPGHTALSPMVELFARTPLGCEPTGITFTPDYKYMFISMQHPSGTNKAKQVDAGGDTVQFNTHTSIVIARKENLGNIPTSLSKIQLKDVMTVFPNPVKKGELLNLAFDVPGIQELDIEVLNINGAKKVSLHKTSKKGENIYSISTDELPSGIYFVTITGSGGFKKNAKITIQ
ncbi:MAG: DUF839 domain-containing protein [Bacteroidia bacterium]|nr:DUF839 domain-containing protein [Bacteroidia bacterium]